MAVSGLFLLSRMEPSQPGDNQVLEKCANLYTGGKLEIDCKLALPDADITKTKHLPFYSLMISQLDVKLNVPLCVF